MSALSYPKYDAASSSWGTSTHESMGTGMHRLLGSALHVRPVGSWVRTRVKELRAYQALLSSREIRDQTKFVIFAQGRTGSDLLRSLIQCHPSICCEEEILAREILLPASFVLGRAKLCRKSVYGFKLKIYQLTRGQKLHYPGRFVSNLVGEGWRIVYLSRWNMLRQVLSGIVAEHRNAYQYRLADGPLVLEPIRVNCAGVIAKMRERKSYLRLERRILKDIPYFPIVYENDLLRPECQQNTLNKLFGYLGVRPVPVHSDLLKITPMRLSDFVDNWRELVRTVRGTEFEEFVKGVLAKR